MRKNIILAILIFIMTCGIISASEIEYDNIIDNANALIYTGKYKQAVNILDKAQKMDSKRHEAYQLSGIALYNMGQYTKSLAQLQKAISRFSGDYVSLSYSGMIYTKKRDYKKAKAVFDRSIKENKDYPLAYIGIGELFFLQKQNDKGIQKLKKAFSMTPEDDVELHKQIGAVYTRYKLYNNAITVYKSYTQKNSDIASPRDLAKVYLLQAACYEATNSPQAEKAYRNAANLNVDSPIYDEKLATYLQAHGKLTEAEKYYARGSKKGKMSATSHCNYGVMLFQKQKLDVAIVEFKKALKINSKMLPARIALSAIYLRLNRYSDSIKQNDEILKVQPTNDTALYNNACAYAAKKQNDRALDFLKKAIKAAPENKKYARDEKMFQNLKKLPEFIQLTSGK